MFRSQLRPSPLLVSSWKLIGHLACACLALTLGLVHSHDANAHKVGISKGTYRWQGTQLIVQWDLARGDLLGLVDKLDQNRDRKLSAQELKVGQATINQRFSSLIKVSRKGQPCTANVAPSRLLEKDGVHVQLRYTCKSKQGTINWRLELLEQLPPGHRHLATVYGAHKVQQAIFFRNQHTYSLTPGVATAQKAHHTVAGFFVMGIEHILIGWDHLLFLFALILLGGRFRDLLGIITAFTVAHSITLSVAALGLWIPPSRWVEALIALSVAYIGIENLFVKKIDHRWKLTFAFGLIHGFGFAGVLSEIGLPPQGKIASLVLFNLGVEAGQVLVMALLLPIVLWAHRKTWLNLRTVRALSTAVVLIGLFWFVQRIL